MEARRQAETGGSHLWRCHGKLYDLEPFLDVHPGGRVWLELTRGTDVTQAFEAYHLDGPKTRQALERFFVRHALPGEFAHGDRFTFEEDGFFRTVRRRLLERLRRDAGEGASTKEATAPSAAMRAACAAVLGQFAAAHLWARRSGSLAAASLVGFFFGGLWGVGHNFMHQSTEKASLWQYVMDITGNYASQFRISHGLSHHLDTNLDTDWEHQFYMAWYKEQDTSKGKAFVAAPLALPMMAIKASLEQAKRALAGTTGGSHPRAELFFSLMPLIQLASFVQAQGLKRGLAMHAVQWATHSALFVPLALGVHHAAPAPGSEDEEALRGRRAPRNTYAWKEGHQGSVADFGEHQVAATTDHSVRYLMRLPAFLRDYLCLTLFGYLNNHTMHHLFPGVDHGRLAQAYDVYIDTAREFGLVDAEPVAAPRLWAAFYRYFLRRRLRPAPRSKL